MRALIVYQVDAIAFTPLVESGWDNVLREAKSASVPLLSIDRAIRGVDDVPLQHIGFDYASLAEQAADALLQQRMPRDGVLELYGTVNASDAREIARGCRASLEEHGLTVTYSLCGDGMRSRGWPKTGQGCADLCVWRRCGAARAAEKRGGCRNRCAG